jgi:zinc transporter
MNIGDMTHGSDKAGLVCAYVFDLGGRGAAITADGAEAWLANPTGSQGFLWLHFNLANAASERWLARHLDLPREFTICSASAPPRAWKLAMAPCWRF